MQWHYKKVKKTNICLTVLILVLTITACAGKTEHNQETVEESVEESASEKMGDGTMNYHTEEIRCHNGQNQIYGVAYIPEGGDSFPLVIFSHELGNNHESGTRYAERLAENGYAAYVFDFCGGSAPGTENLSDGSNSSMSVMTEAGDLEAVLEESEAWDFVDSSKIFLLGGSQGGLVTTVVGSSHQNDIAGMMLMYPALSIKEDSLLTSYESKEDVPSDVSMFGGWIHVGSNYITDIWDVDFYQLLSSYQGKILLLHGDRDGTVDLSYSERAADIIPDCEFRVISGGGHEFFGQPFEDAAEYILQYLDSQLSGRDIVTENNNDAALHLTIGDSPVEVKWEDNESVDAIRELADSGGLEINMSMYGGFEQVGSIGQSIPRNDEQTTTKAGDIVLYSGNQVVVFYGSNSWAYTRLGRITDKTEQELSEMLGNGDVVLRFEMK